MRRLYTLSLAAVLTTFAWGLGPQTAEAQRVPGNVGIGFQIGDPSGVTLQFYNPEPSWDFLAAWDWDDFFLLNVHALYERPLGNRPDLYVFYGPGAFLGFVERAGDDEISIGISGTVGIGYLIEQFEIFGQLTPRLSLVPSTDGHFGGGIGARYYF